MKQETRSRWLARRAAALLVAASAGVVACRGSPATISGAGGAGAGGGAGGAGGADAGVVCYALGGARCPCGTTDISGTTPSGSFAATKVSVGIEGSACPGFGSLDLGVSDDPASTALTFTIALAADAGPVAIIGAHAVSVAFRTQTSPAVTTSGVVTVTAADDARAAYASYFGDGGVWSGMVAGSLTMSQDGFSISGTFEGWYCTTTLSCAQP